MTEPYLVLLLLVGFAVLLLLRHRRGRRADRLPGQTGHRAPNARPHVQDRRGSDPMDHATRADLQHQ